GRGCIEHPAFPAPSLIFEGDVSQNSDAIAPRECGVIPSGLFDIQIGSSRHRRSIHPVMPALVAGIHALLRATPQERGWRDQSPTMTMSRTGFAGQKSG